MRTIYDTFFASGYWIHILVFFCISITLVYLHGRFWVRALNRSISPISFVCMGLVSVLGLEELLCWPIVAYRLSSNLLMWLTMAVLLIPPVLSFVIKENTKKSTMPSRSLLILTALVIVLAIASSVFEYKPDADDSFYVSNVALFSQAEKINLYDSSMGDITTSTVPMYDFQIWESFMSVICRLFHLKATVTMHTLSIAPLIFISASAYFTLGKALFREDNKALFFTLIITIYHLGCRYYGFSEGSFLLVRIWQGKSINLNVVLPLLTAETITVFTPEEKSAPHIIWLCVLAGVAVNPTSLYINGFELLFLSISMIIIAREFKRLPALVPVILITVFFTLLIYFRTKNCVGKIEEASSVSPTFFKETATLFFGSIKFYVVLYALSLIYIFFRGNKNTKAYFLLSGLLMFVFLWNPVSGRIVAEKITKAPTYWRVFWLVPIGAGISWVLTDIVFSTPKHLRLLINCAVLILVIYGGTWSLNNYKVAQNVEKISPSVMSVIDEFQEDSLNLPVLACADIATTIRQENVKVWLLVSRRHYIQDVYLYFGREEEGNDRLLLYDFVNNSPKDYSAVPDLLDKYCVERVIVSRDNENAVSLMNMEGWRLREDSGEYYHYEKKQHD